MAFVSSKHSKKISIYLGPLRLPPQAVRREKGRENKTKKTKIDNYEAWGYSNRREM